MKGSTVFQSAHQMFDEMLKWRCDEYSVRTPVVEQFRVTSTRKYEISTQSKIKVECGQFSSSLNWFNILIQGFELKLEQVVLVFKQD